MYYKKFEIINYRAIKGPVVIDLSKRIIPIVGINECGKTTILQAILCFDYLDDNTNVEQGSMIGKHLQNVKNLYDLTDNKEPLISATISGTCVLEDVFDDDFRAELNEMAEDDKDQEDEEDEEGEEGQEGQETDPIEKYKKIISEHMDSGSLECTIVRHLTSEPYYTSDCLSSLSCEIQNLICRHIVRKLPYVLYNDDFNERPPESINVGFRDSKQTEWEQIFERVFKLTDENYSLQKLALEESDNYIESMLEDVSDFLNKQFSNEWEEFLQEDRNVSLRLKYDKHDKKLQIKVKDTNGNRNGRYFNVYSRSKGFVWFYNFIMKVRFNPKYIGDIKDTIFLLDEPGSYLHEFAQSGLCKRLKDISEKEGNVIYCTHSPRLLDVAYIPLNNILIVSKKDEIIVTNISNYNQKTRKNTALQPVYDALLLPEYKLINNNEKIICVEGIYDKYALEFFTQLSETYTIFPSVNAESIINNIQYFIAYNLKYIALWDNDKEGKKCEEKAQKTFGDIEAKKMTILPNFLNSGKVRMEEMIFPGDYAILRQELGLEADSTYEAILFTTKKLKSEQAQQILKKVSEKTKTNFAALSSAIKKMFKDNYPNC